MPTKKSSENKVARAKTPSKAQKQEKSPPLANAPSTGCCMGTTTCSSPRSAMSLFDTPKSNKKVKTRIVVKYDVGFNNHLFVRGKGANLSWEKGTPLKNVKNDEWVWETELPILGGEFKVLINDESYECGENRKLVAGACIIYTPSFS